MLDSLYISYGIKITFTSHNNNLVFEKIRVFHYVRNVVIDVIR